MDGWIRFYECRHDWDESDLIVVTTNNPMTLSLSPCAMLPLTLYAEPLLLLLLLYLVLEYERRVPAEHVSEVCA